MNIALHRGNTFFGVENSFEAINPDISSLQSDESPHNTPQITFNKNELVFEVDVILKPPFLICHNTDDLVSSTYRPKIREHHNDENTSGWSYDLVKNKKLWELKESDINNLIHIDRKSHSKPLILKELLELAKTRGYRLYLDVKLPEYCLYELTNYFDLYYDTQEMLMIIADYTEFKVVDCVVSFSLIVSVLIRYFALCLKNCHSLVRGMFCWAEFQNYYLNLLYMYFCRYLISPDVVSYSYRLIKDYREYLDITNIRDPKKRYVWSIHKTKLNKVKNFLQENNLTPVVDMYDQN